MNYKNFGNYKKLEFQAPTRICEVAGFLPEVITVVVENVRDKF